MRQRTLHGIGKAGATMDNQSNRDALAREHSQKLYGSSDDAAIVVAKWNSECDFRKGYDARDEEIAELKEYIEIQKAITIAEMRANTKLQSQLTAAREEARALREALRDAAEKMCWAWNKNPGLAHSMNCSNHNYLGSDANDQPIRRNPRECVCGLEDFEKSKLKITETLAAHAEREEQK